LTGDQQLQLHNLLLEFQDIFSRGPHDLGRTGVTKYKINTGNAPPVRQHPRRLPFAQREEAFKAVEEMHAQGIIEPSTSPWASPGKKKDGGTRFCVDYRKLNELTKKDSYPLPRVDTTLDALSGSSWFSILDLKSGYWQVEVEEQGREKTAFTAGNGLWQFNVMAFGLCNASATFERLMDNILGDLRCLVYLDDMIAHTKTFELELQRLTRIFSRLRVANLKLNPKKCELFRRRVKFLGHVVSEEGVATDPEKVVVVTNWPLPQNVKDVRSFLGLCTYYRRFVPAFADIARPLHKLTEKGQPFTWTKECDSSFHRLKEALASASVLAYPESEDPFVLDTDASNVGIGAVLSQVHQGHERVIAYYSQALSKPERNYCTTRRELLAIVKAIDHFHPYLYGRKFTIRTDHASLQWLLNFKNPEGQIARWLDKLQTYDFRIVYRTGRSHQNADVLSRRPCFETNCKHCQHQEEKDGTENTTSMPNDRVVNVTQTQVSGGPQSQSASSVREGKEVKGMDQPEDEQLSPLQLQTHQMEDKTVCHILGCKEAGKRPEWASISHLNSITKAYWAQWDSLAVKEGVLYHRWELTELGKVTWQLVLPKGLRISVLKKLHDNPVGGQLGVFKTLAKVRERFYWIYCRRDVEEWCQRCDLCAARKGPRVKQRSPLQLYNVGEPMERVAIDVLGPLPETDQGNKYILIAMDYFSKWPEAYALPNQEAVTVADVLVSQFFSRFGVPGELHSDQGQNFESSVFQEVCTLLGIHKTRTTALHPQSDGMVERYNRTIEAQLATFFQDHQKDWDRHLPLLLMSYRSAVHETTKFTPAMLMFGRELSVPLDLLIGRPQEELDDRG